MKPANDTVPKTASDLLSQHYSTPSERIDGRLPLRVTVLRPFGLSRQAASQAKPAATIARGEWK